jgi:leucyl-tRNA synthetase
MFLYDIGFVPVEEPFKRLVHNGMIIGPDGHKMSKSRGNVVNPIDYDSDEMRMYLCFISHFFDGGIWSDQNISGIRRFIGRFKEWMSREGDETIDIEKFEEIIFRYNDSFKFNKIISEFMTLVNKNRTKNINKETKERLIQIIKIYMPGFNI